MASNGPMILCDGLVKIYKVQDLEVVALQGLDLMVDRGEFMAIIGRSRRRHAAEGGIPIEEVRRRLGVAKTRHRR